MVIKCGQVFLAMPYQYNREKCCIQVQGNLVVISNLKAAAIQQGQFPFWHTCMTRQSLMENQNLSASTACANCFFRHFPKDMIWSYFSYFEMARLDNIFKAAGVCRENMQPNHLINLFLFLHTLEYLGIQYNAHTNKHIYFPCAASQQGFTKKINWFG